MTNVETDPTKRTFHRSPDFKTPALGIVLRWTSIGLQIGRRGYVLRWGKR